MSSGEQTTLRPAERTLVAVLVLLALVLGAFALHPLFQNEKIPFVVLVPVFALFGVLHAGRLLGWRAAALFFAVTAVVSLGAELAGTTTGAVFGPYHYTGVLGPKLFGEVPVLIPLAWFTMIYPSWVIANLIVSGRPAHPPRTPGRAASTAFLGAATMTAWDLTLDPYMVGFEKAWVWETKGAYFGIPIQNYVGWVATSFLVMWLFTLLRGRFLPGAAREMPRWLVALPLAAYGFQSVGDILFGSPPETLLISPFAMGIPLLFAGSAVWRTGR